MFGNPKYENNKFAAVEKAYAAFRKELEGLSPLDKEAGTEVSKLGFALHVKSHFESLKKEQCPTETIKGMANSLTTLRDRVSYDIKAREAWLKKEQDQRPKRKPPSTNAQKKEDARIDTAHKKLFPALKDYVVAIGDLHSAVDALKKQYETDVTECEKHLKKYQDIIRPLGKAAKELADRALKMIKYEKDYEGVCAKKLQAGKEADEVAERIAAIWLKTYDMPAEGMSKKAQELPREAIKCNTYIEEMACKPMTNMDVTGYRGLVQCQKNMTGISEECKYLFVDEKFYTTIFRQMNYLASTIRTSCEDINVFK